MSGTKTSLWGLQNERRDTVWGSAGGGDDCGMADPCLHLLHHRVVGVPDSRGDLLPHRDFAWPVLVV